MARRGHQDTDYLFWSYDFFAVQENSLERLKKAIDDADASSVQEGTVDEVADRFVEEFRLEVPELTEGAMSVDLEEAHVDVTGDFQYAHFGPGPHYVPGIRASYYVPFAGDPDMFKVKPTTWTTVIPAAAIVGQELRFTMRHLSASIEADAVGQQSQRLPGRLQFRLVGAQDADPNTYASGPSFALRSRIAASPSGLNGIRRFSLSLAVGPPRIQSMTSAGW
jgi:hypothetical protein